MIAGLMQLSVSPPADISGPARPYRPGVAALTAPARHRGPVIAEVPGYGTAKSPGQGSEPALPGGSFAPFPGSDGGPPPGGPCRRR